MKIEVLSPKYGKHIIYIDKIDYDLVKNHTWSIAYHNENVYAVASINSKTIKMHRLIAGFPKGRVDHKDNNGLNNKRNNLRIATVAQNAMNKKLPKNNTTGFKGVLFVKKYGTYTAHLKLNGRYIHGGTFDLAADAAKKYNEMAIMYFGEFANINIIKEEDIVKVPTRPVACNNTSGYRGVTKSRHLFKGKIMVNGKNIYLGEFLSEKEAAIAYNNAVIKYSLPVKKLNTV